MTSFLKILCCAALRYKACPPTILNTFEHPFFKEIKNKFRVVH